MERSEFNGKAIEGLRDLVDHRANQQERSRQLLADFAEGHGGTNPSEEERKRRGCHEQCAACSDPTPDP